MSGGLLQVRRQRKHGRWVKSWYVQIVRWNPNALRWGTVLAKGGFDSDAEAHAWGVAVRRLA